MRISNKITSSRTDFCQEARLESGVLFISVYVADVQQIILIFIKFVCYTAKWLLLVMAKNVITIRSRSHNSVYNWRNLFDILDPSGF